MIATQNRERMSRKQKKPLFIVFEGIDGAGKTTQARLFADRLRRMRDPVPVTETREPTAGPWGKKAKAPGKVPGRLMYFLHDRKVHVSEVIRPALEAGRTVVCDRYEPSTLAYQTILHKHPREVVETAMALVDAPRPDLVIWLRVPPDMAVERETPLEAEQENRAQQRLDFRKLDQMYELLRAENPATWIEVGGEGTPVEVDARIWNAFRKWRKERGH